MTIKDATYFNQICADKLPGYLGIKFVKVTRETVIAHLDIKECHLAPNGYLHAGTVVTLADTACGNGCIANLPDQAQSFTTIELKSNHVGTVRDGTIECIATPVHTGRTTQEWDATVTSQNTCKTIALFRCTQMILYP